MKYRELFELEAALTHGCNSKHWPLLKVWDRMLAAVREVTEPYRERVKPTPAIVTYQRALARTRSRCQAEGDNRETVDAKIRALNVEHAKAITDTDELRELDAEMADDDCDLVLASIDEKLLHDGDVLRIEPAAFLTLSRLGLVKE